MVQQFHSEATEDLSSYRPLSKTALLAFVIAIISIISLSGLVLAWLPFVGIALSLVAIFTLKRNDELAGKGLAYSALVLSVVFVAWVPTSVVTHRVWVVHNAKKFCGDWLELVREDDIDTAFSYTMVGIQDNPLQTTHSHDNEEIDKMFNTGPLKRIRNVDGNLRYVGCSKLAPVGSSIQMVLFYEFQPEDQNEDEVRFGVAMERRYYPSADAHHWQVLSVDKG